MYPRKSSYRSTHIVPLLAFIALSGLNGCTTPPASEIGPSPMNGISGPATPALVSGRPDGGRSGLVGPEPAPPRQRFVQSGSGHFVEANSNNGEGDTVREDGRAVTLDFNNAETATVARVFFEEILREPVVVDAGLTGRVTLRTPQPISKPRALAMVREAMAVHGASLTRAGGVWRVGRSQGGRGTNREGGRIVRLQHISPDAARAALGGIAGPGVEVSVLPGQQALSIAGPASDVETISDAIRSIDVDQMRGMSFGLIPLRVASASTVAAEVERVIGRGAAPDQQNFQAIPVTRMNALLIITRRPALLAEARRWIERLDQGGVEGRRIFVYPLQNRRAADVARVLGDILPTLRSEPQSGRDQSNAPAQLAGQVATQTVALLSQASGASAQGGGGRSGQTTSGFVLPTNAEAAGDPSRRNSRESADAIRVSADIATNSVVAIAKPEDRPMVEAAIRRLDVLPAQVLIEATIAEVRLGDNLRHGVRWYFESQGHSVSLTDSTSGSFAPVYPGLNYVFSAGGSRVVIHALEQITSVDVVSSPALTVLDNQTARLQVGDQVPITTRSSRSVATTDAPVVNDIELRDTGVILSVTPRVNASGLVVLDIVQEVSDVVPTTTSTIDSPTIRQRRIATTVAVKSGNEVVLGGMIGTSRETTNNGVPFLQNIPLIGNAFRSNAVRSGARTELLIILRPTVIGSQNDLRIVTDQIRSRLRAGR